MKSPAMLTSPPSGAATSVKTLPGGSAIWFFVFFEAFLFTSYFTVYMVRRVLHAEQFLRAQSQLSLGIGAINTLVLLVSSWSMARCVLAAREGSFRAATKNLLLTVGFAIVFLVIKIYEWSLEIGKGQTFTANEFFSFYYFLTALHFIHLLIGFIFLGVVFYQLRSPARRSQVVIETGATYWHMVDFIWIMIFSLLYLMR